jgi:hypothetical protein
MFPDAMLRPTCLIGTLLIVASSACARDVSSPASQRDVRVPASFGKGGGGGSTSVTLSSVSPDSASLSTTLDVTVSGSGFADGMAVIWQLNGVADPTQIRTNSTRFVSSKQLVANITISGSATSAKWDVALFSGGKTGIGSEIGVIKQAFQVNDPTATWAFPHDDAGLAVRSDHLFTDGVNSVYTDGVCKVGAKIFATTQYSNSGDAVLNTGTSKSGPCLRRLMVVFPDGFSETVSTFSNLRAIENTSYAIPVGATVERQLHVGTDQLPGSSSRCGGLVFGYGVANDIAAGSDSVLVTRVDASTWHVVSQPAPHNLAYCKNDGHLYAMPVEFTLSSSYPLP